MTYIPCSKTAYSLVRELTKVFRQTMLSLKNVAIIKNPRKKAGKNWTKLQKDKKAWQNSMYDPWFDHGS